MENLEDRIREAIVSELKRQAEVREGELNVREEGETRLRIDGSVDLDELSMVVVGALAGGPRSPVAAITTRRPRAAA
jgi:hypothetical protein